MTLSAGDRLGRYAILAPIGAGGMGEVYRARDSELERDVAIKVLPESVSQNPDRLARFKREAKAVAQLSHANILEIWDYGREDDTTYAVTELLEGQTLSKRLEGGSLGLSLLFTVSEAISGTSVADFPSGGLRSRNGMKRRLAGLRGFLVQAPGIGADRSRTGAPGDELGRTSSDVSSRWTRSSVRDAAPR